MQEVGSSNQHTAIECSEEDVSTDLSLAPPSTAAKQTSRVEEGEGKHDLSARAQPSLDPPSDADHQYYHSTCSCLETARATTFPQATSPRPRSFQEPQLPTALENIRSLESPCQHLRHFFPPPALRVGSDPYSAGVPAIYQPTECHVSSPTPLEPSSVVTYEFLPPISGLQNASTEGDPHLEKLGETKSQERGYDVGGVGDKGESARVFAREREPMPAAVLIGPGGETGGRPVPNIWDLNSEEQAVKQAAKDCGGTATRPRPPTHPSVPARTGAVESSRIDLGFNRAGRMRDFGMTMPRAGLSAAVIGGAAREHDSIPPLRKEVAESAEVAGGLMAAAEGRPRLLSRVEGRPIWNVMDPRTGMTVGMWGPPRKTSLPQTSRLHSGGANLRGPAPVALVEPGTSKPAVLAEAAERKVVVGGTAGNAVAVGESYRGRDLVAALRADCQQASYLREIAMYGRALIAGSAPRALLPLLRPLQRSSNSAPKSGPEATEPGDEQRKRFSVPPPLKLEEEIKPARVGPKRDSGDGAEEQPRKRPRPMREGHVAESPGQVYNCRFCGQAYDRPTALGGHMNCHREEREEEKMQKSLSSGRPLPGRLFVAWGPFQAPNG